MSIGLFPFYFVRHGETDWNMAHRIMGQTDIPLNEKGIRQSQRLQACLKDFEFGTIWSSPLQRARQTAEIINEVFHHPIQYTDDLKERGWGCGEGQSHEHFLPHMKAASGLNKAKEAKLPEGAETYNTFKIRIIFAFQEILIPNSKPPLVVSHGGVFQVLTILLADKILPAGNCGLYFFRPPEQPGYPWFIVNLNEA
ncbi:MAG: phosphatase [Alphaproteobacteria bacterium]|jgi:broad specificity phosphatase PhoE|nr:phosphatase [Alphaproteobacteria bacterium]